MIIAISLIAFIISINAPGDPVDRLAKSAGNEGGADQQSVTAKQEKQKLRKKLGLDLPIFYFSVSNLASCDTLHNVQDRGQKENLEALIHQYGNWETISNYYHTLLKFHKEWQNTDIEKICANNDEINKNVLNEFYIQIGFNITNLLELHKIKIVDAKFANLTNLFNENEHLNNLETSFQEVQNSRENMINTSTKWKIYIPYIEWYGFETQYHHWLFGDGKERRGIIRGDFGISYNDSKPISEKIWDRVGISFRLALLSIILAYLVSIPIGIYSAYRKDSKLDRSLSLILFILYSLPSFFVGTVLLLFFANPDFLVWFPESGIKDASIWSEHPEWSDSFWDIFNWERIKHQSTYLVLPLVTYTYSSFAFLSRIMRIGMIDVISQDYIRTAKAKGLSERTVILKHALRNSLLPIITVFAAIFPLSVGGSIIIEEIFSIPGMGSEILNAILNYDYPMIIAFFTLIGFLTMVGYLVADLLYALVDPRISYE